MTSPKTQLHTLNSDALAYWLALHRCPGFGPRRFNQLLLDYKSLSNCFLGRKPTANFLQWCRQHGINALHLDWQGVEEDLAWARLPDAHIITIQDPHYPLRLREIASAPPILFVQGKLETLQSSQLALVGSRSSSPEGRENAFRFAYALALRGFTITSGLALGIDTASHEGALAAGQATIAVLGQGLDPQLNQIYPRENKILAKKIAQHGALVSEFSPLTPPKAAHFPQRNRIISGLSLGVLVLESGLKSGSLITAQYALEQGREVFAVPGSIHNPLAKGCHQLIRQGAKCVEDVEQIVEELPPCFSLHTACTSQVTTINQENPSAVQLLTYIGTECTSIDQVIDQTGLTAQVVSSMLLELELQGIIASIPGGYIRVAQGR